MIKIQKMYDNSFKIKPRKTRYYLMHKKLHFTIEIKKVYYEQQLAVDILNIRDENK